MIEILVLAGIVATMLAKHTPKRKYRRYLKGQVNSGLVLGTLAATTLVGSLLGDVLTEKAWLSSVKAVWALQGFTPVSTDGPLRVGVAHSDYSDAEIEAWIENSMSWEQSDKIGQEIARRKIRQVGIFQSVDLSSSEAAVLNDGKPIHTKCNWQLTTGQTLKIWAYNEGSDALTTGATVHVSGHCNLWPN